MKTFSEKDLSRIANAVRFYEAQAANSIGTRNPRQSIVAPQWGFESYVYHDPKNGGWRVHTCGGYRLVLGNGQPEYVEDTLQDWKAEQADAYIWMRYAYADDAWIDARCVYSTWLPDDTETVRTVLVAEVSYDATKGYRVHQCRDIIEVQDVPAIDDESYSSFTEESYSYESDSSGSNSSDSPLSDSSASQDSESSGLMSTSSADGY